MGEVIETTAVPVEVDEFSQDTMFLREAWASGKTDEGEDFELSRNVSGQNLIVLYKGRTFSMGAEQIVRAVVKLADGKLE